MSDRYMYWTSVKKPLNLFAKINHVCVAPLPQRICSSPLVVLLVFR
jgi:hypothetical protein